MRNIFALDVDVRSRADTDVRGLRGAEVSLQRVTDSRPSFSYSVNNVFIYLPFITADDEMKSEGIMLSCVSSIQESHRVWSVFGLVVGDMLIFSVSRLRGSDIARGVQGQRRAGLWELPIDFY